MLPKTYPRRRPPFGPSNAKHDGIIFVFRHVVSREASEASQKESRGDAKTDLTLRFDLRGSDVLGVRVAILVLGLFLAAAAIAQTTAPPGTDAITAPPGTYAMTMSMGKVFTYFLVMLGPFRLLVPFLKISAGMDKATSRKLALRGFVIACVGGLAAALIGRAVLEKWGISMPALLLTAGLVLLLIALQAVLSQFWQTGQSAQDRAPSRSGDSVQGLAFSPLAFPNIITPYGCAVLILLASADLEPGGLLKILGIFLAVMVLNLAAMWFAAPIVKHTSRGLTLVAAVLGVLQVALAVQMMLIAGRMLHVVP